eukprot:scaffold288978_cov52-Attheya_sp.AAC.2
MIHNTMQIVQLSNANAHGFLSFPVFQSPAKKALVEHRTSNPKAPYDASKQERDCWGCRGNHTWWDRINKQVSCPNKDQPGIKAAADTKFTKHKKRLANATRIIASTAAVPRWFISSFQPLILIVDRIKRGLTGIF